MNKLLILVIVAIATYTDIKTRIIPNRLILFGLATGITISMANHKAIYLGISILIIIIFLLMGKGLGYGDQKLLAIIPLFLWGESSRFFFILAMIYLLYYSYQKCYRIEKLPFAPGILAALLLCLLCTCLFGANVIL